MKNYQSILTIFETEKMIEKLRDYFQLALSRELNLTRVSAPLFVLAETGLNDNLSGIEEPVAFQVLDGKRAEIVQSLAKWKRKALKDYEFPMHTGLYTDMNAIRKDETIDAIHSYYVDQWDWELVITEEERTNKTLEDIVNRIYKAMLETEKYVHELNSKLPLVLPKEITFISSEELADKYPSLNPKEREHAACKEHGAIFLTQIGKNLKNGTIHDGRSPDYDDWELNGDILVWYDVLDIALELSSMGIRVDSKTLLKQLKIADSLDRLDKPYHQQVFKNELPFTIGGGIGQSRLCMFLLKKAHIGEVQVSVWPEEMIKEYAKNNIKFL